MKKRFLSAFLLLITVIGASFSFFSCSKEPYPYDLSEYITVPQDWSDTVINESEINARVQEQILVALKNSATQQKVTNRAAREGDIVNVSFKCYHSATYSEDKAAGNHIQDISDESCTLQIGAGKYPIDMEVALVGKHEGDEFQVRATLPESFTVDGLAGKLIMYEIKVLSISEKIYPAYDDAFVSTVSACSTVEEYEAMLFERMKENILWERLLDSVSVSVYPIEEVNKYTVDFVTHYTELATGLGLTLEQYVAKKFFLELNEFHLKADTYAKELVKSEMLMYYFVRTHEITLSDEEYDEGASRYAAEYGLKSISALEGKFGTDYVEKTVLMDKVLTFLASQISVA